MTDAMPRQVPLVKVGMPPRETLLPALEDVLYSGFIGEGELVYRFEETFSRTFQLDNVASTSSGSGALHVALLLAGAGPGREVITTSMTAEPTNTVIMSTGAVPVFADVDPLTGNLSPDSVKQSITGRTSAICVVHYAGYPADLGALREIADQNGLMLVEDCAHALGANYQGQPIGSVGDSAIFSFQAIKHMTTVDGGMLRLADPEQLPEARRLRWFGLSKGVARTEVDLVRPGFKYNMNNVTAAIGLCQLETAPDNIARHKANGTFFNAALSSVSGISPSPIVSGAAPSYWLYTLLCDESDNAQKALAQAGFAASKLHRPNHLHTAFRPFAKELKGVDTFYERLLHIPCGWWVTDDDRERLVETLRKG